MTFGLPQEVRDRLPAHRRSVGTEPLTALPEFWIIGKCDGCGNEWARQGEGQFWNATCDCGGKIRPRRGDRVPPGRDCVGDSEAAWGTSEALFAFRMPETVAVSLISNWMGTHRAYREQKAHADAGWPVYTEPPADSEGFLQWARDEFRFGPKARPIRLEPDQVDEYAALEGVTRLEKDEHTVLLCPFGELVVVDGDPSLWLAELKEARS